MFFFQERTIYKKEKQSINQTSAQALAAFDALGFWMAGADNALVGEEHARIAAAVFPISHPLTVAPAVGAEKPHFLAGEGSLAGVKHGLEYKILKLLPTHGRAAEGNSIERRNHGSIKFAGLKQLSLSKAVNPLQNRSGHGLGVPGAAPVNNSDFTHVYSSFLKSLGGYQKIIV